MCHLLWFLVMFVFVRGNGDVASRDAKTIVQQMLTGASQISVVPYLTSALSSSLSDSLVLHEHPEAPLFLYQLMGPSAPEEARQFKLTFRAWAQQLRPVALTADLVDCPNMAPSSCITMATSGEGVFSNGRNDLHFVFDRFVGNRFYVRVNAPWAEFTVPLRLQYTIEFSLLANILSYAAGLSLLSFQLFYYSDCFYFDKGSRLLCFQFCLWSGWWQAQCL
jgi:hypothetical protein